MFHDTLVPCAERRNINMEMIEVEIRPEVREQCNN